MKSIQFRASVEKFLRLYLANRPLFLSLIRAKEAALYQNELPLNKPILDVGCGDGFFAKCTFDHIDVGLDVVDSRITESASLGVYTKTITYDGDTMPFPDNSFRTVVSNCVFEHIPHIEKTVTECYRVLKPGGKLIITVMAKKWEDHLFGALVFGDTYRNYMRRKQVHLNVFSPKQWEKLFTKSGFTVSHSVGYLPDFACKLIDFCHYISLPSLITYLLWKKWVVFPKIQWYPVSYLVDKLLENTAKDSSGAIYYVLSKK